MPATCLADGAALIAKVPSLSSFAGAELDEIVATTCDMLQVDIWGDKLERAHTWLAAHFCTVILDPSGATGPVVSRTLDKLSESYAVGSFDDAELGSTKYGRLYLALRASLRQHRAYSTGTTPPDWQGATGGLP